MSRLVHPFAALATLALFASFVSATAGERDALVVHEAHVQPSTHGRCFVELLFSPDASFRPSADAVSVTVGGIEILGETVVRTPKGKDGIYAKRWTFRSGSRKRQVVVELDLVRGVLTARGRRLDLAALARSGGQAVPVVLTLGTNSRSSTISFREVGVAWRFVSRRDGVPNLSSQPPFRVVGDGFGYIAGPTPMVVRTEREYRDLMKRAGYSASKIPVVDFAQEVVVAMSLGHSLQGCELPDVQIADVTRTVDDIVVRLSVVRPQPVACSDAYVFYDVAAIVAVPRVSGTVDMW